MAVLQEYKCPCCGGAISFDSTLQKMKCPYCDTEFDVQTLIELDADLQQDQTDDMAWEMRAGAEWNETEESDLVSYVCESCAGEIVCEKTTVATSCPYCDNPVVVTGKVSGSLKPDYVIPFKLNKQDAVNGYKKHLKGKRLLPKVFHDEAHIQDMKGVYVPFWLFDADANAHMRYRATRVRGWSDSDYNYTETQHYAVIRGGNIAFERVPVDGSEKMADDLMESIEPFEFSDAVDFQTAYLAGYLADRYDVTAEQSVERANQRIKQTTDDVFRSTVGGYATVVTDSSQIRLENGKASYALYPVWLLNTTWKGKTYTFAMNGQTGKFVGDLPLDKKAYWKWFFGLTGIFTALTFGFMWLTRYW
ncbi:MAG: hypothetical protein IKV35_06650 [Clostridia bacterium]|nr:hypothetical protein [Clostridia bacterium]